MSNNDKSTTNKGSPLTSPKFYILDNIDWKNFVAGTAGGAISTAIFHPFDLVKIRWQVYENASLKNVLKKNPVVTTWSIKDPVWRPKYKSILDTIASVYKHENGVRGLYRGVVISTVASGSAWGLYFLLYNGLKNYHVTNNSNSELSVSNYTVYASMASMTTICVTNPLFLIKTRMCLQYANEAVKNNSSTNVVKYRNSMNAFQVLLKTDGIRGLYKGLVPGLFSTLNGTIQMVFYEQMKSAWLKRLNRNAIAEGINEPQKLDTIHFSVFSSLSKMIAVVSTYPFQLVRSRLQDQHRSYKNIFDVILTTYRNENLYGFYKGLIPCLARNIPAASVTFVVYENVTEFLKNS